MKPFPTRPLLFINSAALTCLAVVLLLSPQVPEAECAVPAVALLVIAAALAWRWGATGAKREKPAPVISPVCNRAFLAANVWTGGSR